MRDLNGEEIKQGDLATLLCEVIGVEPNGVVVRICNSTIQLLIDAKPGEPHSELVASEELAKYVEKEPCQQ